MTGRSLVNSSLKPMDGSSSWREGQVVGLGVGLSVNQHAPCSQGRCLLFGGGAGICDSRYIYILFTQVERKVHKLLHSYVSGEEETIAIVLCLT